MYSTYTSDGVLIDTTPPALSVRYTITDTERDYGDDIDFTSRLHGIYSDWKYVFSDAETGIVKYIFAVGLTPRGKCYCIQYKIIYTCLFPNHTQSARIYHYAA